MRILAINCGSSSLKCSLVDTGDGTSLFDVQVEIGTAGSTPDYGAAMQCALDAFDRHAASAAKPDAVAHRIVHGGAEFTAPVLIDATVLTRVEALDSLAPLHNPPAIAALKVARARLPQPHVAIFDTAFHTTLPARAREYALPVALSQRLGIRRYGFHGVSHANVMESVAAHLRRPAQELRIVSCHLGNGASVAAIEYGRSVETSMGMTPLEGLVMGTRVGDVDPGVLLRLLQSGEFDAVKLEALLNRESGLLGLAGTNDLREIETRAAAGDEACRRALAIYSHRVRKYIGAYAAVMGGVDAIAFTGGVGEHSALVRSRVLEGLGFLGAVLDSDRNRDARVDRQRPLAAIGAEGRVALFVIQANEEAAMAKAAAALLTGAPITTLGAPAAPDRRVPIAISARHAHLSQTTLDRLFGPGHQLEPRAPLSQTGQFSACEVVTLVGPRGTIENVRLMGPPRAEDQVEISRSDEFVLGVDAPVRLSGNLANTPGITLGGPLGRVTISHGVICARRHIHMNPQDAQRLGVADGGSVSVRVDSSGRDLTFNDVSIRVNPAFRLELHLDTDEANAAGVTPGMMGEILA